MAGKLLRPRCNLLSHDLADFGRQATGNADSVNRSHILPLSQQGHLMQLLVGSSAASLPLRGGVSYIRNRLSGPNRFVQPSAVGLVMRRLETAEVNS